MSTARRRQDVKAEARRRHPEPADPERQARARAELDAYIAGRHLRGLRKAAGKTQAEVARILGVSRSRISQIENGDLRVMGPETLRAYAAAMGERADITISGPFSP